MPLNLYDLFAATALAQPDHPVLLGPGDDDRVSYSELKQAIDTAAATLTAGGLRAGDCVGLHLPSGRDYIVYNYAVWRCGGCIVPVPVELTDCEKQEIGRRIALQFVISEPDGLTFAEPFLSGATVVLSDTAALAAFQSPRVHPAGFETANAAFIRFTSGTTGDSKGVVLSHETIRERIAAANEVLGIGPHERVVWLLSMSWHFAVSIVAYLSFGATIILPAGYLGSELLRAVRRFRGTLIYGSPMHYVWMAHCEEAGPLPDLRLALSTATALDPDTARAFHARCGVPVSQALGLIELGLPCINLDFAADRPEAVGRVLPAYQLRLEDSGLGPGLQEISFRGPGFLDAYYDPWRPRAAIVPDGWFHTGDVGEIDGDDCLFIRGRSKDVISVMGMKFFPAEVEAVLRAHPAVREACVFAESNPRYGDVPCARVVLADGEERPSVQELLEFCAVRLAEYKVPQRIEFVEALPKTASGKLLHRSVVEPAVPAR